MRRLGQGFVALFSALGCLLAAAEAHAACMGRPTDAEGLRGYKYTGEVKSFATEQVRVHWATSGSHAPTLATTRPDQVPDTVAFAADTAEAALKKYAEMGYRKIPSDAACPSHGDDDKVDIYLVKFAGADGSTVAECDGSTCPSFALVEATFNNKGYASAQEGFRTVVTHELFHAIQNVYQTNQDGFWAEGSAQWAMKTLHPELQDFERQLPAFFNEPTRSIDAPPGGVTAGFLYGSSVWPLFLSIKYGQETIREVLEAQAEGAEVLDAIDGVLKKKSSSLADAYPLFAAWNASTGAKAASEGGYPDAAKYPGIKLGTLADGATAITSGFSYYAYRGTLEAPQIVALEADEKRVGGVVVPIVDGKIKLADAKKLPANAEGEVLVVVSGVTAEKTDAPFKIAYWPPEGWGASSSGASSSGAASSSGGGGGDEGCNVVAQHKDSSSLALVIMTGLALLGLRRRKS